MLPDDTDRPDRRERPRHSLPSERPPGRTLKRESELKSWITGEFRKVEGCGSSDSIEFVLVANARPHPHEPSWYLRAARGWGSWSPPCRKAFLDIVVQAQERFDLH